MFVTVCDKNYLIGFEVMLKSLTDNNPRVIHENIPFTILSNDITEDDIIFSKQIHNNIVIKKFDVLPYLYKILPPLFVQSQIILLNRSIFL